MAHLREKSIQFLSALDGYHELLKTLHWQTGNKSEHLLTDDIDEAVLDYQDKLAEVIMGRLNTRFTVGELKSLLPSSKTLESMLAELEADVTALKNDFGDDVKYNGIQNVLDDFLTDINQWNYLRTFK